MTDERQRRLLVLCLATVYLVWSTSYMATRIGALNLPPRSALGAVLATTSLDGTVEGRQIVIAPRLTR